MENGIVWIWLSEMAFGLCTRRWTVFCVFGVFSKSGAFPCCVGIWKPRDGFSLVLGKVACVGNPNSGMISGRRASHRQSGHLASNQPGRHFQTGLLVVKGFLIAHCWFVDPARDPDRLIISRRRRRLFVQRYSATPPLVYPRLLGYAVGLVMHIINMISMMNTFKGDLLQDPAVRRFHDDQFKFLTIWNVNTQMLYLALGLSCDVLSLTNEDKDSSLLKTLKRIRDPMFSSLIFPVSLTVATVFWSCFSYERSLILPPSVDQALGWTSNHIIHTAIVPVVLWEVVFRPRRAPETHVPNQVLLSIYVGAYMAVIITSYLNLGVWVYPILNLLDGTVYLYPFFCIGVVLAHVFYRLQWYLTALVWGSREDMKKVH